MLEQVYGVLINFFFESWFQIIIAQYANDFLYDNSMVIPQYSTIFRFCFPFM